MLPPSLEKALTDSFHYAMELKNGMVIEFESASLCGKYAHLDGISDVYERNAPENVFVGEYFGRNLKVFKSKYPRGIDIAIDEIVWVCDAPEGS